MTRLASPARVAGIGTLVAVAAFGHVLYPAWLALRTRGRADPVPPEPSVWPDVTVLVPAYRERSVIAAKVEDVTGNGYPGRVQVLVVADDEDTAEAAAATAADVVTNGDRRGKAHAINVGLEAAGHDLVVLTDANASFTPGTLAALVRWFEDDSVGAVAGEKRVLDEAEGLYWRFESWLKRRESRLGTTIGLVGELAAVKRSATKPLPTDLLVDDLWIALDVVESAGGSSTSQPRSPPSSARPIWARSGSAGPAAWRAPSSAVAPQAAAPPGEPRRRPALGSPARSLLARTCGARAAAPHRRRLVSAQPPRTPLPAGPRGRGRARCCARAAAPS